MDRTRRASGLKETPASMVDPPRRAAHAIARGASFVSVVFFVAVMNLAISPPSSTFDDVITIRNNNINANDSPRIMTKIGLRRKLLLDVGIQSAFTHTYRTFGWGGDGGGSGAGSSVHFTVPLRAVLERFVSEKGIKSM